MVPMKSSVRPNEEAFDPQAFLAKVADGQTLIDYSDRQTVFAQGDCADSIFYIHKGRSKSPSFPTKGRRPSLQFSGPANSLARGASLGKLIGWPRSLR